MSIRFIGWLLTAFILLEGSAQASQQVKIECWKRLSDGDVHADTSKNPEFNAGFMVLSFKENRKDAEWSYGLCLIAPRSPINVVKKQKR